MSVPSLEVCGGRTQLQPGPKKTRQMNLTLREMIEIELHPDNMNRETAFPESGMEVSHL
jgi:hypothetical protein